MGEALRGLIRSSSSRHRPWQLAAAISMGVLCGLLPKLNLTFCLVGCLCCLLPIHLPLAAASCVLAAGALIYLAPVAGRLGMWSLTHPGLRDFWMNIDALPVVPWFALHNSVVHGGLLLGLTVWWPLFLVTKPLACWLFAGADDENQTTSIQVAVQADPDFKHELIPNVGEQIPPVVSVPAPIRVELSPFPKFYGPPDMQQISGRDPTIAVSRDLQKILTNCHEADPNSLSVHQVVERASQIAQYVDELLADCEQEPIGLKPNSARLGDVGPSSPAPEPISPSHYVPVETTSSLQKAGENSRMRSNSVASFGSSQNTAILPRATGEGELLLRHEHHPMPLVATPNSQESVYKRPAGDDRQREALRYLLHHLKAFKEKV